MAKEIVDRVDILNGAGGPATVTLNGNRAVLYAGGNGKSGQLRLRDDAGVERIIADGRGRLAIRDEQGRDLFVIESDAGNVLLNHPDGRKFLRISCGRGLLELGGESHAGRIEINDASGAAAVRLEGDTASVAVGAQGNGGDLTVLNDDGGVLFQVAASSARLRGAMIVGGRDAKGEIGIMDQTGRPAIYADGGTAKVQLGNLGNAGDFSLLDNEARPVATVDGLTATLALGGEGKPGYLVIRDQHGQEVGRLSGNEAALFLGRKGTPGEMLILDEKGQSSFSVDGRNSVVSVGKGDNRVLLDGSVGDIKLGGADCAEQFEALDAATITPGTVLVIAQDQLLDQCSQPYDTRVAGVVSGAGGARPGIVLNSKSDGVVRVPVALNGRVYCKVDADHAPIEVGDLLTTSSTPGHAMKICERGRAHGCVIGKALRPLRRGCGLIPVLVALS